MITLIWNFLLKNRSFIWNIFKYFIYAAIAFGLWFGAKRLFFTTWDKIAFSNSKVERFVLYTDSLQYDLKLSQMANDSLSDLNYECAKSFNSVNLQNQKNIDSLVKVNKILRSEKEVLKSENKELSSQIDHLLEVAPCTEIVEVKDKNPFKKNKKVRVFVDCPEIEIKK